MGCLSCLGISRVYAVKFRKGISISSLLISLVTPIKYTLETVTFGPLDNSDPMEKDQSWPISQTPELWAASCIMELACSHHDSATKMNPSPPISTALFPWLNFVVWACFPYPVCTLQHPWSLFSLNIAVFCFYSSPAQSDWAILSSWF